MTVPQALAEMRLAPPSKVGDRLFKWLTMIMGLSVGALIVLVAFTLWRGAAPSVHHFGPRFLTSSTWDPVQEVFGALPFIYGTVVSSALALLVDVPLGVGAAIFLSELAPPRISNYLTFVIELLAAVPSVIYGLLGIFILVPVLRKVVMPFLKHTLGFLPFFK